MSAAFTRIAEEVESIQNGTEDKALRERAAALSAEFKLFFEKLKSFSDKVNAAREKAIKALPADATDAQKAEAAKAVVNSIEMYDLREFMMTRASDQVLPTLIESIFVSAAFMVRDHQLQLSLPDESETLELIKQASSKIYDLQRTSYRLKLLKQNPGLVAFFEKELSENQTAHDLYKRWVKLLARALTNGTVMTDEFDVRVAAAKFSDDLRSAINQFPKSLALQQMQERQKILNEVLK
jgi:hypothetical protein